MTGQDAQQFLLRIAPGCQRTNPQLFDRLGRMRTDEVLVSALPLYGGGYIALTNQRLMSPDRPPAEYLRDRDGCLDLADVREAVLRPSKAVSQIHLLLRGGETVVIAVAGRPSEVRAFAGAIAGSASGGATIDVSARDGGTPSGPGSQLVAGPIEAGDGRAGADEAASQDQEIQRRSEELLARTEELLQAVKRSLKARAGRIVLAERAYGEAGQGRRLRAIGVLQRVVLYEDRISTPQGTFDLSPDVHARCEQHGVVQSVQGWVVKSDQDRREVYLHINGPGWHSVNAFKLKWSTKEPREFIEMAYAIGEAAQRSPVMRATIAQRQRDAGASLKAALAVDPLATRAAEELPQLARDLSVIAGTLDAAITSGEREDDRSARRRAKQNAALAERCRRVAAEAELASADVRAALRAARERSADVAAAATLDAPGQPVADLGPNLADPAATLSRTEAGREPAAAPAASADDVLSQIERLARLKDIGAITADEYDEAKAHLLRRL